jgi:hypothetical protein
VHVDTAVDQFDEVRQVAELGTGGVDGDDVRIVVEQRADELERQQPLNTWLDSTASMRMFSRRSR